MRAGGDDGAVLVTGANTGIGRATATALAHSGRRVILACRSEDRAGEAMASIRAGCPSARLEFLPLDLADLESVAAAARTLLERDTGIDVLIANAGVGGQRGRTAQGFELAFGVNHLGHFLFTTMLVERLCAAPRARLVVLSSVLHLDAPGIDFAALCGPTRSALGVAEYRVSKLCNVLFVQELARRVPEPALAAFAVHPGGVASDILRRIPGPVRTVVNAVSVRLGWQRAVEDGAVSSLHCATSPTVLGESGSYYDADGALQPASGIATPELAAELWERSEAWVAPHRPRV